MNESHLEILPAELRESLEKELEPGERVMWVGQPSLKQGDWKSAAMVWIGLEWTVIAILFTLASVLSVVVGGAPICFAFSGLPSILIGIWVITGPSRMRRFLRNTVYAVTDLRAIVIEQGNRDKNVRSFVGKQLTKVFRVEKPDGSGDVILSEATHLDTGFDAYTLRHEVFGWKLRFRLGDYDTKNVANYTRQIGFFRISEVKKVEGLIKELADRAPSVEP